MSEPMISIRLAWPFWRLLPDLDAELGVLRSANTDVQALADPKLRIPRHVAGQLLEASTRKTGDTLLGLRAGVAVEPAELGPLSLAARSSRSLRDALNCSTRYLRLLDEALETSLVEQGDLAIWRFRHQMVAQHPASTDFAIAAALTNMRRYLGGDCMLREIRLPHRSVPNLSDYERILRAPVTLGAEAAIVFRRTALSRALVDSNRHLHAAFVARAEQELRDLPQGQSLAQRVRAEVGERIGRRAIDMGSIAKALHMTPSTLRRRLSEEATTHSAIVDAIRRERALVHLRRRDLAISEIAFLLGYSSLQAFNKAVRRWTGRSPQVYRGRTRPTASPIGLDIRR